MMPLYFLLKIRWIQISVSQRITSTKLGWKGGEMEESGEMRGSDKLRKDKKLRESAI
jgi:hypothetical protein